MTLTRADLQLLAERAKAQGFAESAFFRLSQPSALFQDFFAEYLSQKLHAGMSYLENPARMHPESILPGAQTGMALLFPYRTQAGEIALRSAKQYRIARYALGRDYHTFLRKKMKQIAEGYNARGITDSAPFPERYYARVAGLGFIGRNGMLIHKEHGSYFFLAFLLFPSELPNDFNNPLPELTHPDFKECGTCTACLRSCPSSAILPGGLIDSEKCISYQTIERKGTPVFQGKKHNYMFGCDICQQVCPYNKGIPLPKGAEEMQPTPISLQLLEGNTDLREDSLYGTPLQRRKPEGIQDNAMQIDYILNRKK